MPRPPFRFRAVLARRPVARDGTRARGQPLEHGHVASRPVERPGGEQVADGAPGRGDEPGGEDPLDADALELGGERAGGGVAHVLAGPVVVGDGDDLVVLLAGPGVLQDVAGQRQDAPAAASASPAADPVPVIAVRDEHLVEAWMQGGRWRAFPLLGAFRA